MEAECINPKKKEGKSHSGKIEKENLITNKIKIHY